MNTQAILNHLISVLLIIGIVAALIQGDALWAICFGCALIQQLSNNPNNTGEEP